MEWLTVTEILRDLELPWTPQLSGPQWGGFLHDSEPELRPTEAEPIPGFVFDQSLPDEFDD